MASGRVFSSFILPAVAVMFLCQCGLPQPPQCRQIPRASRAPAAALVAEAQANWTILANPSRRDDWNLARDRYNQAVAKLFDQLRCGSDGWTGRADGIGTRIATESSRDLDPARLDALFPAAMVNTRSVKTRQTTPGLGVPVVGWKKTTPVGTPRPPYQMPNGMPSNLTAILAFDQAGPPTWHFVKRWNHNEFPAGRASQPLAADWSAPNAFLWQMCQLDDLTIQNVILPDRFTEETGIYFVTPYDPEKIPVVFVHGLVSSPDAFKNIINELAPEPWFRDRYQIWLYNYPTGPPWIYSSMNFRDVMRETCAHARSRGHDRNLRRMVVVGHSMGGLLTRSSVTDPGTVIYDEHFSQPIDQLNGSAESRRLIRDMMLYQPLEEPSRVVFMAVPHRGSPMANLRVSTWISRLVRLPKTLTVELLDTTFQTVGNIVEGEDPAEHLRSSINSLSPKSKPNIALARLSLPSDLPAHSVIGDRGKNDTPDSSDGVVPYWSSHLESASSELIIPSNHSVPDHPEAAAELGRILKLHLEE